MLPTSTWQSVTAGYVGTSHSIYFWGAKWEMIREVLRDPNQENYGLNCSIKPECGTKREVPLRRALLQGKQVHVALPLWLSSSVTSLSSVSPVCNCSSVGMEWLGDGSHQPSPEHTGQCWTCHAAPNLREQAVGWDGIARVEKQNILSFVCF